MANHYVLWDGSIRAKPSDTDTSVSDAMAALIEEEFRRNPVKALNPSCQVLSSVIKALQKFRMWKSPGEWTSGEGAVRALQISRLLSRV